MTCIPDLSLFAVILELGGLGGGDRGWGNAVRVLETTYHHPLLNIILDDCEKCLPISAVYPSFPRNAPCWELGSEQAVGEPAGHEPRGSWYLHGEDSHVSHPPGVAVRVTTMQADGEI